MSTRGLWGFVLDGQEKLTYNHSDSYPSGLGGSLLAWLRSADLAEVREQVAVLRLVDEQDEASAEDVERLSGFANRNVGTKQVTDWYVLLRETQGRPGRTLDAGVMIDGHEFGRDSLFCEWGYVVDLDANVFEVYQGFQEEPHTAGRFAGLPSRSAATGEYHPVRLIASYPLDALPESLDELEGGDE